MALVTILRKGKTHLRPVGPRRPASDAQVHSGLWGTTCPHPEPTSGDRRRYGGRGAGRSDKGPRSETWNPKLEPQEPGRWPLSLPGPTPPAGTPHRRLIPAHARPAHRVPGPESGTPPPPPHHPADATHISAPGARLTFLSRSQHRRDHREQEAEREGLGARHAERGAAGTAPGTDALRSDQGAERSGRAARREPTCRPAGGGHAPSGTRPGGSHAPAVATPPVLPRLRCARRRAPAASPVRASRGLQPRS